MLKRLWSLRREAFDALACWTGLGRAFELVVRPRGAIVLMYHSVAGRETADFIDPRNRLEPGIFERHLAFLGAHRRVVPFSRLLDDLAAAVSPPAGTVCITFDDGYLDNLTLAAPLLAKYRLPATLFLATGYVGRGEAQWADAVHWMIERRRSSALRLPALGMPGADLASLEERADAKAKLHRHLLQAGAHERRQLLAEIERQLRPAGRVPRLTLTWADVRELRERFPMFEIGGHTQEHLDLREHRGARARAEIEGCAQDIRRELGIEPAAFSFPYGRWCDETRELARAAGWPAAVAAGKGVRVLAGCDRFTIPRVEAPGCMASLRFRTSGAYPGVYSMLGLSAA